MGNKQSCNQCTIRCDDITTEVEETNNDRKSIAEQPLNIDYMKLERNNGPYCGNFQHYQEHIDHYDFN